MHAELMDAAAPAPFRTRTFVLFAAAAPRAVVLRRGPRTHWQLLAWDLKADTFTPGQWMKGEVTLCDLSPRGDKLIYFAAQYHRSAFDRRAAGGPFEPLAARAPKPRRGHRKVPRYMRGGIDGPGAPKPLQETWTAISTPPYFTALALWPAYGKWTGGGVFRSDHEAVINEPPDRMVPIENVPIPPRIRARSLAAGGWIASATSPSEGRDLHGGPFWQGLTEGGADWVDWVHVASQDQLLFACDGCIYRLRGWRDVAPGDYLREAIRIADLSDARFTLIQAPPSALRW